MPDEASAYRSTLKEVADAFRATYSTPVGRLMSDTQTAYSLAIMFDLAYNKEQEAHFGERLAFLVRREGYRLSTGFLGTPLLLPALTRTGHADAAIRVMLQTRSPSWLYQVAMGATTTWERWDSLLPDGSVNPGEMTSFNHYALGAVASWLHRLPRRPRLRYSGVGPSCG